MIVSDNGTEPPGIYRSPFGLSYAAEAGASSRHSIVLRPRLAEYSRQANARIRGKGAEYDDALRKISLA